MAEKDIKDLRKLIYATLKEFKISIEEYLAINTPEKDQGGKKSVKEFDLSMFAAKLPECLDEHKNDIGQIYAKVKLVSDETRSEAQQFVEKVVNRIIETANTQKVKQVTCQVLVEDISVAPSDVIIVLLKNGGITITYKSITGTLESFGFNTSKIELKFNITKTESNPEGLGQYSIKNELDALFARVAAHIQSQLVGKEFATKIELEQWVWSKQEDIKKYLEGLITEITQSGLEDLAGISNAESTVLKTSIKKLRRARH